MCVYVKRSGKRYAKSLKLLLWRNNTCVIYKYKLFNKILTSCTFGQSIVIHVPAKLCCFNAT